MGETLPPFDANARLGLKWPRWYPLSAQDRLADAQTLQTLSRAGLLSRETAVASLADTYDIADVTAETQRIADAQATRAFSDRVESPGRE